MNKSSIFGLVLLIFTLLYGSWHYGRWYGYQENSKTLVESYNRGYRSGMLYAYDNVVICGASPEEHGLALFSSMKEMGEIDENITNCGE